MVRKNPVAIPLFFLLFFLFQWGGQFAAAAAARSDQPAKLFYTGILYACFLLRGGLWLFIIKDMPLSYAYALSSLGYLIIPVLSRYFLQNPFKAGYVPGGLLILAGITLFGYGEQKVRAL